MQTGYVVINVIAKIARRRWHITDKILKYDEFPGYLEEGMLLQFCSAMISGLATCTTSLPVDVVKTRYFENYLLYLQNTFLSFFVDNFIYDYFSQITEMGFAKSAPRNHRNGDRHKTKRRNIIFVARILTILHQIRAYYSNHHDVRK